ncbi:hypothetical protein EBR43_11485 [bacterium]|nr:hypothetical protein [bacterium]
MENLSLEGLTPEQIKLLESVADGFRVKKEEPVVAESPKDKAKKEMSAEQKAKKAAANKAYRERKKAPKFYRIISTCWYRADDMQTGVEIDFIAKIRSDDPNSLECISSDTGFFDFDELKSYIEENGFDLKWYRSCKNPQGAGMDIGTRFYTDVDKITEEEYNDSDKWKDAKVKEVPAEFTIVSSGFTTKI